MQNLQITIDGVDYPLQLTDGGEFTTTNTASWIPGEYPITVSGETNLGKKVILGAESQEVLDALKLIIVEPPTESGKRMIDYYPYVIKRILDFQALINAEGYEIDDLKGIIIAILDEAYLTTMGEERIKQWEKLLGLTYSETDTLEDRREVIIAHIRGQGKLNSKLINTIVNTFTGGFALSYIKDSVLYVEVSPPQGNKQFVFENIVKALIPKIPAHLGLVVIRNYATWGEVKDNFADWNAVREFGSKDGQLGTWDDVYFYVAPQVVSYP